MRYVWLAAFWLILAGCQKSNATSGPPLYGELPEARRIPWKPGVPGGIPERTEICANVKDAQYGAAGDGIQDDTDAIQKAIDACAVEEGVVYLPEGIYKTTKAINVNKSYITVRGAGPDKTRIQSTTTDRVFYVGNGGTLESAYVALVAGYEKGSALLTLADASSIKVGDFLLVDQENDPAFITSDGLGGSCTWCGELRCSSDMTTASWKCGGHGNACDSGRGVCEGGKRALGHIVEVVSKDDNQVGIEPALYWTFSESLAPKVLHFENWGRRIGIEDLYITRTDPAAAGGGVYLAGCAYCWLRNLELANTPQYHVYATQVLGNELRHNFVHDSLCYTGNHGYGFALQGHVTATLIENNVLESLSSPVSFSAGGGGNVVAYNYFGTNIAEYPDCGNYSYASKSDVTQHGAHPILNLYEGNVMGSFGTDFYWGSASHITAFRNKIQGYPIETLKYKHAVALASHARYYSFLGNILGRPSAPYTYETSGGDIDYCWYFPYIYSLCYEDGDTCVTNGCDPQVEQTLLRHGNYDYANNAVVWDETIAEHTLPDSYYLIDGKPSWWGTLAWPPFGPDTDWANNTIPAQQRYDQLNFEPVCGNGKIDWRILRITVDDSDPDCTLTGNWQKATGITYSFKNGYATDGTTGPDSDTLATFTIRVPVDGDYKVYFVWYRLWNSPDAVPVLVEDGTSTHEYLVNENENCPEGGFLLGTLSFRADTAGKLTVSASDEGVTTADAVRLERMVREGCDDGNTSDSDGCPSDCDPQ